MEIIYTKNVVLYTMATHDFWVRMEAGEVEMQRVNTHTPTHTNTYDNKTFTYTTMATINEKITRNTHTYKYI